MSNLQKEKCMEPKVVTPYRREVSSSSDSSDSKVSSDSDASSDSDKGKNPNKRIRNKKKFQDCKSSVEIKKIMEEIDKIISRSVKTGNESGEGEKEKSGEEEEEEEEEENDDELECVTEGKIMVVESEEESEDEGNDSSNDDTGEGGKEGEKVNEVDAHQQAEDTEKNRKRPVGNPLVVPISSLTTSVEKNEPSNKRKRDENTEQSGSSQLAPSSSSVQKQVEVLQKLESSHQKPPATCAVPNSSEATEKTTESHSSPIPPANTLVTPSPTEKIVVDSGRIVPLEQPPKAEIFIIDFLLFLKCFVASLGEPLFSGIRKRMEDKLKKPDIKSKTVAESAIIHALRTILLMTTMHKELKSREFAVGTNQVPLRKFLTGLKTVTFGFGFESDELKKIQDEMQLTIDACDEVHPDIEVINCYKVCQAIECGVALVIRD